MQSRNQYEGISIRVLNIAEFPKFGNHRWLIQMAMDQYLLIPFLGGWTSIYQLFWCSPGIQGFDTLPDDVPPQTFT